MENRLKRKARRVPLDKPARRSGSVARQGFGFEMPPDPELVQIYFDQKGFAGQAPVFFKFYDDANWRSPRGTLYRNWKTLATDWIFNYQQDLKLQKRLRC